MYICRAYSHDNCTRRHRYFLAFTVSFPNFCRPGYYNFHAFLNIPTRTPRDEFITQAQDDKRLHRGRKADTVWSLRRIPEEYKSCSIGRPCCQSGTRTASREYQGGQRLFRGRTSFRQVCFGRARSSPPSQAEYSCWSPVLCRISHDTSPC